jgi:hypothetical protein
MGIMGQLATNPQHATTLKIVDGGGNFVRC